MFSITIPVPTILVYVAVAMTVIMLIKFAIRFVMG